MIEFSTGRVSVEFNGSWFTTAELFDAIWSAAKKDTEEKAQQVPLSPERQTTADAIAQVRAEASAEVKPLAAASARLKAQSK